MDNSQVQTKSSQADLSPGEALNMLKEGNRRFTASNTVDRDLLNQVEITGSGQYPFAVVLGCIDSRVPAELLFDQGIGDIFNVRIAGNFVNTDILGSIEFGCKVAGSKVIVVLGHTHCGAVKGACDNVQLGNLTSMLDNIMPAVNMVPDDNSERSSKNPEFVQKVADNNVQNAIEGIRTNSPVLKEMEDNGEIMIVGAMYNVETGAVEF